MGHGDGSLIHFCIKRFGGYRNKLYFCKQEQNLKNMPRSTREKSPTGICHVLQGKESKTCPSDSGSAIKTGVFFGANWKLNTIIKRIPGCEDLTRKILQLGTDIKMSLIEYIFDTATEKKQEEQRKIKEDNDE